MAKDFLNTLTNLGGRGLEALRFIQAVAQGGPQGISNFLQTNARAAQDPALRQQMDQSGLLSGAFGYGAPQTAVTPDMAATAAPGPYQRVAQAMQQQGVTSNPSLPPLTPAVAAQQAKDSFESQLWSRVKSGDPQAMAMAGIPSAYGGTRAKALNQNAGDQYVQMGGRDWVSHPDGTLYPLGPTQKPGAATTGPGFLPAGGMATPTPMPQPQAPTAGPLLPGGPGVRLPDNAQIQSKEPIVDDRTGQTIPANAPPAVKAPSLPPYVQQDAKTGQLVEPSTYDQYGNVKSYKPYVMKPPKVQVTPSTYAAWATGNDPLTGGAATPEQVTQGKKYEKGVAKLAGAKRAEITANSPAPQKTVDDLALSDQIKDEADQLEQMLQDPDVQHWVGLLAGRGGMLAYQLGKLPPPNPEVEAHFVTMRSIFSAEAKARLMRLAGARNQRVWDELSVHPPQPGDTLSLLKSKIETIRGVVAASKKSLQKYQGATRQQIANMPDDAPSSKTGKGATPKPLTGTPGNPVEIMPGVWDMGPAQ